MSKYYKGKYLILKIAATAILLTTILLNQFGTLSSTFNSIIMIVVFIAFFIIYDKMRKNEEHKE